VTFNYLNRDFFNALAEKDVDRFQLQLVKYLVGFAFGEPGLAVCWSLVCAHTACVWLKLAAVLCSPPYFVVTGACARVCVCPTVQASLFLF
jgi:hypothetical protein